VTWLLALALVGAAGLVATGYLVSARGRHGLAALGHREATLPSVLAGRYVGMGVILGGLALMQAWGAVTLVLVVYAGFGLYDAWVVRRVGGDVEKHFGAALLALFGALVVVFATRGGA
jgi:hypothetical protein